MISGEVLKYRNGLRIGKGYETGIRRSSDFPLTLPKIFLDEQEPQTKAYQDFWSDLRAGNFKSGEFKRLKKDGGEIWIRATYNPIVGADGRVLKIVKFASDVTREQQAKSIDRGKIDAIERSQAVIEFELDGTIVRANDAFLTTVGYTMDEILGRKHAMFVSEEHRASPEYREMWAKLNKGEFIRDQFRRYGKNQKEVWILGSYNPIFDSTGKVFRVVKFATDITEDVARQESREAALKEVNRDLTGIAASVSQSTSSSKSMATTTEQASMGVQEIAAGIEELAASAGEITSQLNRVTGVTSSAVERSKSATEIMSTMADEARAIGDVIALIQGIAEQTNLLALNATIEAARAGEAGKGFAVVASEVKELANQASSATETISSQIASIRDSSSRAVSAIEDIQSIIGEVDEVSTSVAGAVEEQTSVTSDLSASMQQISSSVAAITEGIREIASTSQSIDDATQSLKVSASGMV
mgnify:CR=1 FL=1